MESILSGIVRSGWLDIVGDDFEAAYLDSPFLRGRSANLPVPSQRPLVHKLVTPDGRKYKLLQVPDGNRKVLDIVRLLREFQSEEFVPDLLWSDKRSLLLEFFDGAFPDITSDEFAKDLALAFARLHSYRYSNITTFRYRLEFLRNLRRLEKHNIIDKSYIIRAKKLNESLMPAYIRRSLDYFDIKRNNFVYTEGGQLKLIDVGAFKKNRPTGQFFVGSNEFASMNQDIFWEAYRSAGGDVFAYQNSRYLQLFYYVMKVAQRARLFSKEEDKTSRYAERSWERCMRSKDVLIGFLDMYT